jgi:acyl-CoA thioester hydrolase
VPVPLEDAAPMHEKKVEIRWRDMDAYGHVNNAVFLNYLEEARDEWMQRLFEPAASGGGGAAAPVGAATESGQTHTAIDYVVARVAIDYRGELTQADREVRVRCRLDHLGRSSIHTREEIVTWDGRVAAEAQAVLVVRDPATRRPRPLQAAERRVLEGGGTRETPGTMGPAPGR